MLTLLVLPSRFLRSARPFGLAAALVLAAWSANASELPRAEEMLDNGDAEAALMLVRPCLEEPLGQRPSAQLRHCLVVGQRAGQMLLGQLMETLRLPDQEVGRRWDALGLTSHWQYGLPRTYRHDYGRRLLELFPEDPLAAELHYAILTIDGVAHWPDVWPDGRGGPDEARFLDYLEQFDGTRWAMHVRLHLARHYNSLWDLFANSERWQDQRDELVTGDHAVDLSIGMAYRRQALALYAEVRACAREDPSTIEPSTPDSLDREIQDLVDGRPAQFHTFLMNC